METYFKVYGALTHKAFNARKESVTRFEGQKVEADTPEEAAQKWIDSHEYAWKHSQYATVNITVNTVLAMPIEEKPEWIPGQIVFTVKYVLKTEKGRLLSFDKK